MIWEDVVKESVLKGKDLQAGLKMTCPACSHNRKNKTDPCLHITKNKDGQLYAKCHHCEAYAYQPKIEVTEDLIEKKETYKKKKVLEAIGKEINAISDAFEFLQDRGFSTTYLDTIRLYGLKEDNVTYYNTGTAETKPSACFHYWNEKGQLRNIKTRCWDDKKFMSFKSRNVYDSEMIPYGLWYIEQKHKDTDYIYLTEGEFDAIAIACAGLPALSLPNGAKSHMAKVISDLPKSVKKIYYFNDTDSDGIDSIKNLWKNLQKPASEKIELYTINAIPISPNNAKDVEYNKKTGKTAYKDANDLLQYRGLEYLKNALSFSNFTQVEESDYEGARKENNQAKNNSYIGQLELFCQKNKYKYIEGLSPIEALCEYVRSFPMEYPEGMKPKEIKNLNLKILYTIIDNTEFDILDQDVSPNKYDIYAYDGGMWQYMSMQDFTKGISIILNILGAEEVYFLDKKKVYNEFATSIIINYQRLFGKQRYNQFLLQNNRVVYTCQKDNKIKFRNPKPGDYFRCRFDFTIDEGANFAEYLNNGYTRMLEELMHPSDVTAFGSFCGYLLENSSAYKKALFVHGSSNTGKSTILKMIYFLFEPSDLMESVPLKEIEREYYIAKLENKAVNIETDLTREGFSTRVFKTLTSQEYISARHPYGQPMKFIFDGKLIIASNEFPKWVGDQQSIFNRLMSISLEKTPTKIIENIEKIIWAEDKHKILIWFLHQHTLFRKRGLLESHSQETINKEMRLENLVNMFLDDFGIEKATESDSNIYLPTKVILEMYRRWQEETRNTTKSQKTSNGLSRDLKYMGFVQVRKRDVSQRGAISCYLLKYDPEECNFLQEGIERYYKNVEPLRAQTNAFYFYTNGGYAQQDEKQADLPF